MAFDISQQQQNTSGDQERMAARAGPCLGGDRVTAQGEQGSIAERVGVPGLSQHLVHFVGVAMIDMAAGDTTTCSAPNSPNGLHLFRFFM